MNVDTTNVQDVVGRVKFAQSKYCIEFFTTTKQIACIMLDVSEKQKPISHKTWDLLATTSNR